MYISTLIISLYYKMYNIYVIIKIKINYQAYWIEN